jgi:hypothetical protein
MTTLTQTLRRFSAPLALIGLLAACGQQEETVNQAYGDPMEQQLANAAPVELPPALKASKTYRCKDNSLVVIDFMADDLTAQIRSEQGGPVTKLKAAEKGEPFTSDDGATSVEGSGPTVTVKAGGKAPQSCKG